MKLLYLYPEEWTGRRAREVHTLCTCLAMARNGCEVMLLTGGGERELRAHVEEVADGESKGFRTATLSRSFGLIRSAALFNSRFQRWLRGQSGFDTGFVIHLKAAAMLRDAGLPYLYEAHEIFAETPHGGGTSQSRLGELESLALKEAEVRVATSLALADALRVRYALPNDFVIVPNAGDSPLERSVASANGPFVYCGSIAGWKGLELIIEAAGRAGVPLKIVGGSEAEWKALGTRCETQGVAWQPRVAMSEIPRVLEGARAGLIPTLPEPGAGQYSCPMKLFDYARCGLPVVSTMLPALRGLQTETWCTTVFRPTVEAWTEVLREFRFEAGAAEGARRWSAMHTWDVRGRCLVTDALMAR